MIITLAAAAVAAATPQSMHWEGSAAVWDGDRKIPLTVRTTIGRDGSVRSNSWPTDVGVAKGLHRLEIKGYSATMTIGGKSGPTPAAMVAEERRQFGFYWQLQDAARWCRAHPRGTARRTIAGLVATRFTCRRGEITQASNRLEPSAEGAAPIEQRFTFKGWWRRGGAIFPRHMMLTRSGKPYFMLEVARFDAR
jgi:hypothetical protein